MLLNDIIHKDVPSDRFEVLKYWARRTGFVGFSHEEYLNWDNKGSSFLEKRNVPGISVNGVNCLRVYFGDIQGYKIPQLSLYIPKSGFPLVSPNNSRKLRQMSKTRENILRRHYVEIPYFHIMDNLVKPLGKNIPHALSVAFSSEPTSYYGPIGTLSPFSGESDDVKVYISPNYAFYRGDSNNYDLTGEAHELFSDLAALDDCKKPSDKENFYANMLYYDRCYSSGEYMSLDAFMKFLPLWMLYYPNKWITLKDPQAGPCGGELDPKFPGYNPYYLHSKTADFAYGEGLLYKHFYECEGKYTLSHPFHLTNTSTVTFNWERRIGITEGVGHATFNRIPAELVKNFAAVASWVHSSNKNKFYPFKKRSQKTSLSDSMYGKCFFTQKALTVITSIMSLRTKLDSSSELTYLEEKCPKCELRHQLPKGLAQANPNLKETVCVTCGYKYLVNLIATSTPNNQGPYPVDSFWFEDYSLDEIFCPLPVEAAKAEE